MFRPARARRRVGAARGLPGLGGRRLLRGPGHPVRGRLGDAVIVYHVAITTSGDYLQKREPHRKAHLERLMGLRSQGLVIGGGPSPDGRGADVFYRVQQPDDVRRLVEEDPYVTGGVWASYT